MSEESVRHGPGQTSASENVKVVRRLNHALGNDGLDAAVELWQPDVTWRAMAPNDVAEMRGRETVRRYVQDWLDTFDELAVVSEEVFDAGEDRVVAVQRTTGRAKLSGIETNLRYAVVYTLRDGKISGASEYRHKSDALGAVGLEG
jgi:ketosteroid isomerase-like protein